MGSQQYKLIYRILATGEVFLWSGNQRFPELHNNVEIGSFIRVTRRRTIIGLDHLISTDGKCG